MLFKDISCGSKHSAFLSMDGYLYTCGSGERGQLGIGMMTLKEYQPQRVKLDLGEDRIKQIACGNVNTAFLTDKNHVYIFGDNSKGQLGIKAMTPEFISKPILVDTLSQIQIRKVVLGGSTSCALTFRGDIYVWGLYADQILPSPVKISGTNQPPFKELKAS